jgi:[acyl-carrier-protein] S-malonyltransferase
MIADGVEQFVEVGPGSVLQGLVKKIQRDMPATSIQEL